MTQLKKNSELDSLANVAADDSVNIRDVSDITNQATGETKRIAQRDLIRWVKGADIASAAALSPGADGSAFDVTGTVAITSINTVGIGTLILLHFDGILTLTHHATNLVLPGGTNITTAAGDEGIFYEYNTGQWRCVGYSGGGDVTAAANIADNKLVRGDGGAKGVQETTIVVDDNGQMTNPSQPCFSVKPSAEQTNIAINTTVTIILDTEIADQNNDFSANTFTAPVTGKYLLCARLGLQNMDTGAAYYNIEIVTSNRTYATQYLPKFTVDLTWQITVTVVADMDAADTAHLTLRQEGGTSQTDIKETRSDFSGALIC